MNIDQEKRALRDFRQQLAARNILLIEGDRSQENLVYIENAPAATRGIVSIRAALQSLGLSYRDETSSSTTLTESIAKADLVFIYAHGEFGEDGRLQGLLDYADKPYQGPGVLASAVCLDKLTFKRILTSAAVQTPNYRALCQDQDRTRVAARTLGYPLMAKLRTGGSSLGITLIEDEAGLEAWLKSIPSHDQPDYLLERYIAGRFVTVSIIQMSSGLEVLPILEVVTDRAFYDEHVKLAGAAAGSLDYVVPAELSCATAESVKELAVRAFEATGCAGLGRVDLMLDARGQAYVLEINTVPGLSAESNFTNSFKALGFDYEELIVAVLRSAYLKDKRQADISIVAAS
jgi:D-alanine-D-alanine ligase